MQCLCGYGAMMALAGACLAPELVAFPSHSPNCEVSLSPRQQIDINEYHYNST